MGPWFESVNKFQIQIQRGNTTAMVTVNDMLTFTGHYWLSASVVPTQTLHKQGQDLGCQTNIEWLNHPALSIHLCIHLNKIICNSMLVNECMQSEQSYIQPSFQLYIRIYAPCPSWSSAVHTWCTHPLELDCTCQQPGVCKKRTMTRLTFSR